MDPSIIKLLEDDEDESMHCGADVEAFTAALNRDIEGDTSSISQPSDSETGVLSKGSSSMSQQLFGQWQNSSQEKILAQQIQHQEEKQHLQLTEQHLSQMEPMKQVSGSENQHQQIDRQQEHDQLLLQPENSHTDRQQQTVANPLHFVDNQVKISEQNSAHCPIMDRAQHSESQKHNIQLNSQQAPTANQANNSMKRIVPATIPFQMLIPKLHPNLDKDKSMQLQALYTKLRTQEITKENFLRVCKSIVGDQMLRQAVHQVQIQLHAQAARQTNQNQYSSQIQVSSRQPHIPASTGQMQADANFSTLEKNSQNLRETENRTELKGVHATQTSSNTLNAVNPEGEIPKVPLQAVNKPQQQIQLPQTSFSMYGSTSNFHAHGYPRPSVGAAATSLKSQTQNLQMRQATFTQGMTSTQLGATQPMNIVNVPRYELQNAAKETNRLHAGPLSHLTNQQQRPVAWQSANMPNREQRSNAFPSMAYVKQEVVDQGSQSQQKPQCTVPQGSSIVSVHTDQGNPNTGSLNYERHEMKTKMGFSMSTNVTAASQISGPGAIQADPAAQNQMQAQSSSAIAGNTMLPKKPSIGQKKPLEVLGSSPPQASKKQKTSGSGVFLDQSIEQLNDVTAVSGVNLREEEEQLLSAPKEDSRASEATRKFVQEEEERLILQKDPLQKKLAEIMSKCGIESISSDVERCLSMCVEERMRGLISNMIRLSKQRIDFEKTKHRFVVTSDVRCQILMMNQKAKEEWEKKQAEEAEKLRKQNETEGNTDADKDKDEGRSKIHKTNKEEDDKMRTTAANVAARAAVGGDDMLSKWQLMAEQARQKREGILDGAFSYQEGKSASGKPLTNFGRTLREQREAGKRGASATSVSRGMRMFGRHPGVMSHPEVERIISTKDLIAILEREPQMSRSTLIYHLYERMAGKSTTD